MVMGLFTLLGCRELDKTELALTPIAPVLNIADGAVIVLKEADKDVLIDYDWNAADFGVQVVKTYTLQMDKQGNSFADPIAIGVVTDLTELSIKTSDLNSKLLPMLADPTVAEALPLEFRVKADINTNVTPAYSAVIHQTITPYIVKIVYPILNVPGSYQGWNPGDSSTSIASLKSNDIYEGYIWFPDNTEFKYAKGSWDVNWGDDAGDGTLEPGGANILCPVGGYYKLNVSIPALTHTFVRTAWGVVGSATPGGWDADTDMVYDEVSKTWSVTMDLIVGEIKFRANDAWDINYGDDGGNGTLEAGGANIPIAAAGNYTITMDLSKPVYKYTLKQN